MHYALKLIQAGASLRVTARILSWLLPELRLGRRTPCYQTVRQWLLRIGLYELGRARSRGDDWVWLVDHTQQLGDQKGLLIVGLRLSDWDRSRPLSHDDLEVLVLEPETTSTGESVCRHFDQLHQRLGAPRAVISDGASELRLAFALYRQRHPEATSVWLYDIKHFAALLLKRELKDDPTWKRFTAAANRTKQQCSVTALAALNPPNQRGQARYLNLQELLAWARKILALLDHPQGAKAIGLDPEKFQAKLGWLREHRQDIDHWSAAMRVIELTESHVRRSGVDRGVVEHLKPQLQAAATSPLSQRLRDRLLAHLDEQAQQTKPGEHLPASSEVLESLIGTYKHLQGEQSHQGVTPLLLGLGALMTADPPAENVQQALLAIHTRQLAAWCRERFGDTLQSCRQHLRHLLTPRTKPSPRLVAT